MWWFQRFFIFTPIPGKKIQFDEHIFQMGRSHHHQLEKYATCCAIPHKLPHFPNFYQISKFWRRQLRDEHVDIKGCFFWCFFFKKVAVKLQKVKFLRSEHLPVISIPCVLGGVITGFAMNVSCWGVCVNIICLGAEKQR